MNTEHIIYGFNIRGAKTLKELEIIYNQSLFMKKKAKNEIMQAIIKQIKILKLRKYKIFS